ncbi:MAG: J domain-containing protein [Pseudomonadota bacterium]
MRANVTPNPDFDQIYKMLDVDPADGWAVVQQSFRRKAQRYHPDRAKGNPVIEKIAARRFEELNQSFEELKRFYRIFGDLPPLGLNATADYTRPKRSSARTPLVQPKTGVMKDSSANKIAFNWAVPIGTVVLFIVAAIVGLSIL